MEKFKRIISHIILDYMIVIFALLPKSIRHSFRFLFEKLHQAFRDSDCYFATVTEQKVGEDRFKLWITRRHYKAYKTYTELEQQKTVYEEIMMECMKRILDALDFPVVLDLGAFMGYYALYCARHCKDIKKHAKVYAFESNPVYVDTILRSITDNDFDNVKAYSAVLSDVEEELFVCKEMVTKNDIGGKCIRAETLDSICEKDSIKPNIMKLDVHGAEGKVLAGAKVVLRNSINVVLFELHPDGFLEKYSPGYTRTSILEGLKACGFALYLVGGFRYKRALERDRFYKTGKISYVEITENNRDLIFFDRHVDMFIIGTREFDIKTLPCF